MGGGREEALIKLDKFVSLKANSEKTKCPCFKITMLNNCIGKDKTVEMSHKGL